SKVRRSRRCALGTCPLCRGGSGISSRKQGEWKRDHSKQTAFIQERPGGNCESQFSNSWDSSAGGCRSSLRAGSATRENANKKIGQRRRRGGGGAGEGCIREEMRHLPLRRQRCEKNRPGAEGHVQARHLHRQQQQSHRRNTESLDRKRRYLDAAV